MRLLSIEGKTPVPVRFYLSCWSKHNAVEKEVDHQTADHRIEQVGKGASGQMGIKTKLD